MLKLLKHCTKRSAKFRNFKQYFFASQSKINKTTTEQYLLKAITGFTHTKQLLGRTTKKSLNIFGA